MYRPYIKYGKISLITGKILISSLFLMMLQMFFFFTQINILIYSYLITMLILIISLYVHLHYRDKYDIEKTKYYEEKEKPNWRRKQIMKRLLK